MSTRAVRTSQFTGSLGVNVHLEYTDGKYANLSNVLADLAYLGLNQVRDANLNPANQGQSAYAKAAAAGVKFDLFVGGGRTMAQSLASLDAFAQANPGAIESVEGANEVNNWPFSFNGLTGVAGYSSYQSALYSAVGADPLLAGLPVYRLTGTNAPIGGFDFVNIHPYPTNGAQPYAALLANLAQAEAAPGQVPFVITEDGYNTNGKAGSVDTVTQAKETLNMLFDAQKLGASKIFLYQLLDAYSPTTSAGSDQFGLFNLDNTPKPVATAIHNLTAILADPGATAGSFQPGALNDSIANLPSTASSFLMEKSNGAFELALWDEPTIWNAATRTDITVAATQVTISLGATYGEVKVFDPLSGSTPIADLHNVSSVTVGLTDHPLIIEIEPGAAAALKRKPGASAAPPGDAVVARSPIGSAGQSLTGGRASAFVSQMAAFAPAHAGVDASSLSSSAHPPSLSLVATAHGASSLPGAARVA